jgi:uncharacterized protein (PEP-CTERM system associated)
MTGLPLMLVSDRRKKILRKQLCGSAALAAMLLALPGAAQAQFSPGDLVTTPLPAIDATSGTRGRPLTANPPEFLYSIFGDLSERYTNNATGAPAGDSDFETRAQAGLQASEMTNRINAVFNYTGELDYFTRHDSSTIFSNYLQSGALVEAVPDHLLLSADAFAQPIYTSQLGNIAPSGEVLPAGSNSDLRNTYGYSASPDLFFRLGDFLRSDSIPSYSSVFFDRPQGAGATPLTGMVNTVNTKAFTQRLVSGEDFVRLQWSAVANYSQMNRASGGLTQRSATGQLAYAITRGINIVADGGYQTVRANVPLNKLLSGPIMMGGLQFETPDLTGEFRVGEQYRSMTATGHLSYKLTQLLTLNAAATDDVTTPGANILSPTQLLTGLIAGLQSGQIQIPTSGVLTLNPDTLGLSLQNTPARIKTQTVSLQYGVDRVTASVTGFAQEQSNLSGGIKGQNNNMRQYAISPEVDYAFSEELTGSARFTYSDQTLAFGHSSNGEFDLNTQCRLSDTTQLYGDFSYLRRFSDSALAAFSKNSGNVSIASFRIGIHHQF